MKFLIYSLGLGLLGIALSRKVRSHQDHHMSWAWLNDQERHALRSERLPEGRRWNWDARGKSWDWRDKEQAS